MKDFETMKLSSKLTLWYAVILFVIMSVTGLVALIRLNYVLYHQAELEIEFSAKHVFEQTTLADIEHPKESGRLFLLPGVVLRVFDENQQMVHDSSPQYFKMEWLESHEVQKPSIWANADLFRVIESDKHMIIYRRDMPITLEGKNYNLVFLKTVTAEKETLNSMKQTLMYSNLIGLLFAVGVGFLLVRRTLKPVRDLTSTAKAIQVDDLSRRIAVSPAGDEITELANTFNTMLDRLERGFKAQQQFVSDASHELRTPLTVINGYVDMLERWGKNEPEVLDEALSDIKSQAKEMQELVENLLFIARADQKRQILELRPLKIQDILQDVSKKMKVAIGDKHELKLLRCDEALVLGDDTTLKQMVRIFLENSAKYTPEGGHITIDGWLNYEENIYKLELSDDGIGIAKEDQSKLFERFFRVDKSRTKAAGQPGGTGLGLSIAKWIADSHNIKIEVDSELGKGTTFIFKIPLYVDKNLGERA